MANAAQIADLLTAGMRGPQGAEDSAFYTGVVQTWDRTSGVNTVLVNGTVLSNVRSLQSGLPTWYVANDVVVVMRKQTQYFILGKIAAPTAGAGSGVKTAAASWQDDFASGTDGTWIDNPISGVGPTVTAYIGTNGACLVWWQCTVKIETQTTTFGNPSIEARVGWEVSGASTFSPGQFSGTALFHNVGSTNLANGQKVSIQSTISGFYPIFGLNPGSNTWTMKYSTVKGLSTGTISFWQPAIAIIPM